MANNKFVTPRRLATFLDNLKNVFALSGHKHTTSDLTDYKVDNELSFTSTNPVANKTINAEFDAITESVNALGIAIDGKADSNHNHDSRYYTESEIDTKLSTVNTSIANITSGSTPVKEAEHADSADTSTNATNATNANHAMSADSATSATKATQDASGNVITSHYETKTDASKKLNEAKSYADTKVSGLASTTVVDNKISTHNTSTSAHSDIRDLINGLTTRLNTLADSDDTTLDQMSEIVTYIKANKSLIDSITTNKVNVTDIVNNLTTNVSNKPLSAAQGVAIKGLIDALQSAIDSKANGTHTHAISDVNELQTALDTLTTTVNGKSDSSHTHSASKITSGILAVERGGTGNMDGYVRAGQKDGTSIGALATAEGRNVTASGSYCHAEGNYTYATGSSSHAEGQSTEASGSFSHAEGESSKASGYAAHAEGDHTIASGDYSHAQGKYNIEDTTNTYAHIVGNGESASVRSNAHTLDWDGNAWFAGDVYVGGTTQDEGSPLVSKLDFEWEQIYDSGAITEPVNAFANIDIKGYKKLRIVVKCVNDGSNSTSKNGAVTFTATNGTTYQFPCWTTMFTNAAYTSGCMATFEINDGWLVCPNASRILKTSNFLGTEGGTVDNLPATGGGIMKCTNELSTMMVSPLDQDSNYYFLAGSRVMVWGSVI